MKWIEKLYLKLQEKHIFTFEDLAVNAAIIVLEATISEKYTWIFVKSGGTKFSNQSLQSAKLGCHRFNGNAYIKFLFVM